MKKQPSTPEAQENPWDDKGFDTEPLDAPVEPKPAKEAVKETITKRAEKAKPTVEAEYDLEGLMNDFPTATELERFVYDQTGMVLSLKGRANKLKYQVAMDVLNGVEVDEKFIGGDNPYIDKSELVPVEEQKPVPDRAPELPNREEVQNQFYTPFIPHPDPEYRARNKKVHTIFRKYRNGMISYEVLGPIEAKAIGEKMDKFGRMRPELMSWVDPRTGEQVAVRKDGSLTPHGRNLRAIMQKLRVNNTNHWQMWVDRDFVNVEGSELQNPWDIHGEE